MFLAKMYKNYSFPKRKKQLNSIKNSISFMFDLITFLEEFMRVISGV